MKVKIISKTLLLLLLPLSLAAQQYQNISYKANSSVITNPERGFMRYSDVSSNKQYNFLNENTLKEYRTTGISLVFRYFYIEKFTGSDISAEYLANMQRDFDAIRAAGLKAIIRFAYCQSMNKPYGDAPLHIVKRHIEQLKPLLQANADVILVVQAGFIGAWGEWYYTDYYAKSPGIITDEQWNARKAIVDGLLEALPATRMVQLRTPLYKQHMYGFNTPITLNEAYSGSDKARIAHHNDCFLASYNDVGTYADTTREKPYIAAETKYLVMGGETCGEANPYSGCDFTLKEMARMHWSYLNLDYHPDVINGWKKNNCWDEIVMKLGYRYRMISSVVPDSAMPGGSVNLTVKLINEGWANPFNPRDLKIMLRNITTGETFEYKYKNDIRKLTLNVQQTLAFEIGVPQNLPEGTYSVHLFLPDPEPTLKDRPEYAIQMANLNTWDSKTGFNALNANIIVSKSFKQNEFTGNDFFSKAGLTINPSANVINDGAFSDWENVEVALQTGTPYPAVAKFANTADSFYFSVQGNSLNPAFQIFIDSDNNTATGYKAWQWAQNGSDFLIENGNLYSYSGTNGQWGWNFVKALPFYQNAAGFEIAIARTDAGLLAKNATPGFMYVNDPNNATPLYLPQQNSPAHIYAMQNPPAVPAFSTYGTNAIIYWADNSDASKYFVLQRSLDNKSFTNIATKPNYGFFYTDTGLVTNKNYYYRLLHVAPDNTATASPVATIKLMENDTEFFDFVSGGNNTEWDLVEPVATGTVQGTAALKMFNFENQLYYFIKANGLNTYKIYFNTDNNLATGNTNNEKTPGFDFLISNDSLFKASAGKWNFVKKTEAVQTENSVEGSLLFSDIEFANATGFSLSATVNQTLLHQSKSSVVYNKVATVKAPQYFEVNKSALTPNTKNILTWQTVIPATGYVVERSVDNNNNFVRIAKLTANAYTLHDVDVANDAHTYYYRIFAFLNKIRSEYSNTAITALNTMPYGTGKIEVYPVLFEENFFIKVQLPDAEGLKIIVYDIHGRAALKPNFTKIANALVEINGNALKRGMYILKVEAGGIVYSQKIVKI